MIMYLLIWKLVHARNFIDKQYSAYKVDINLLSLLKLVCDRRRVKPDNHKRQKSSNHRPKTSNPDPTASDNPATRIFVVGEVADGDLVLLLDSGEERSLIVNTEREDTVLIGSHKLSTEDGAGISAADGLQGQTVEGREHSELELELVIAGNLEWHPLVVDILRDLDVVDLYMGNMGLASEWP